MQLGLCALLAAAFVTPTIARAEVADVIAEPPEATGSEPPEPRLEEAAAEPARISDPRLLGAWLYHQSQQARRTRINGGAFNLVGSAALLGAGIWAFLQNPPNNELSKGLGLALIGSGGAFMSVGIVQLARRSTSERRLERWSAAEKAGLSQAQVYQFEGELRSQSDFEMAELRAARWTSFGLAMTGALVLGLTAAANLSTDAATIGYVAGGVALGVGLLGFGVSFAASAKEDAWTAYLNGQGPRQKKSKWRAAPAVGRGYAGLHVAGRF